MKTTLTCATLIAAPALVLDDYPTVLAAFWPHILIVGILAFFAYAAVSVIACDLDAIIADGLAYPLPEVDAPDDAFSAYVEPIRAMRDELERGDAVQRITGEAS